MRIMQLHFLLLLCATPVLSQDVSTSSSLHNVSYGNEPEQLMDIFLPFGRDSSVTKVIVLMHGGGWAKDKTKELSAYITWFKSTFPRYAVVTLHYRLGSDKSPGFPKQIEDIGLALDTIKTRQVEYGIQPAFALVGMSAGAHIALLYAYGYDMKKNVKVVCNIVGLTDLTDPDLASTPIYSLTHALTGNFSLQENPAIFQLVSPVSYINSQSPRTISFYGGLDPLVTLSQGKMLEDKLDAAGVYNKYFLYANEAHQIVHSENKAHMRKKVAYFFQNYF